MNEVDELAKLISAERAQEPLPEHLEQNWRQISRSLSAAAPPLAVAHGPLKLGLSMASKSFLGSGLVAFAVTTAGLGVYSVSHPPSVEPVVPVAASLAPSATTTSVAPVASATSSASSDVATPPVPASPSVRSGSSLEEELRLMKAAKRDLDAGRDHLAGVWLEQHARLYPSGVLRSERQGLSVLLGCRRSPGEGREAARTFVLHNRQSPLVDRIARACSLGPSDEARKSPVTK